MLIVFALKCKGKVSYLKAIFLIPYTLAAAPPSVLPYGCIKKIVECIQENFDISKNTEFTIEVNPNSLTDTKLKEYISCGVNRVSMGVQSINDNSLHAIGRKQSF